MKFVEYAIGELALEVKTGKTPPTSNPEYFDGNIPWIGPSDLKGQKLVEDSERKISKIALEDNKAFLYQSGTVLISTIGDIGKTAIVKKSVASNQQLTGVLVNDDIILPELFYYWVRLNKRILEQKANTSVLSMLNNKLLKRVKVVFPKQFEDQYKIVGRLNRIQELIDKRVETTQLLDEHIRSVFLEMFGDPATSEIKKEKLGKLILDVIGGWSTSKTEKISRKSSNDYAILKQDSVSRRVFDPTRNKVLLGSPPRNIANILVEKGDVLFSRKNPQHLVGATVYVYNEQEKLIFPDTVFKIKCNEEILKGVYLTYLFNDQVFQLEVQRLSKGFANSMRGISQNKLLNLKIPLPDIEIQKKFEEFIFKTESIREKLESSLEELRYLFQVTVQSAFSPESQINEEEIFESLLPTFTKEDLKQGNRLKHLLKWIDSKDPRFSEFQFYNLAWDKLRELLEDGSIEQVLDKNEIKLKIVE